MKVVFSDIEKLTELRSKRQELGSKFDELTKKVNLRFKEITTKIMKNIKSIDVDENSLRRTLIISIRNIQSMVIEGYDLYASKHNYESRLRTIKSDYLELVIPRMPISWVAVPHEELTFDKHIEDSGHKMKNEHHEK